MKLYARTFVAITLMRRFALVAGLPWLALIAWHFPWATDEPVRREDEIQAFYDLQYAEGPSTVVQDTENAREAIANRDAYDVMGRVRRFVDTYDLHDAKVLEVGSGEGYLQDMVTDYTGLDISRTAARHYHKPFVAGTATALPFDAATFDAIWSIWTLEHIPNPEAALLEMRRVVKPGGLLYVWPAWNTPTWAAQGYAARPYADLDIWGKAIKASLPLRSSVPFWLLTAVPSRALRSMVAWTGPTQLHYRRLTPNYAEYWQADSDAVASLDALEMRRWYESRGDACLNCLTSFLQYVLVRPGELGTDQRFALIIRRSR